MLKFNHNLKTLKLDAAVLISTGDGLPEFCKNRLQKVNENLSKLGIFICLSTNQTLYFCEHCQTYYLATTVFGETTWRKVKKSDS